MRKKKKLTKWPLLIGLILAVGLVVLSIMGWAYTQRQWWGEERFTVLNTQKGLVLKSFDPQTNSGITLKLPDKLEISTVGGKGDWRVESLERLVDKHGWEWVKDSVGDALGIEITGVDKRLGWWDKWQWIRRTRGVDWRKIDLGGYPYMKESIAVDGSKYLVLDERWGAYAKELFGSMSIINENIGVVVINSAGVPGLGSHAARAIDTTGMRVVMINNDNQGDGKSCRITINEKLSDGISLKILKKIFKCQQVDYSAGAGEDITVRLGQDYQDWWLGSNN